MLSFFPIYFKDMGILQVMVSLVTCKVVKYQAINIGLKKSGKLLNQNSKIEAFMLGQSLETHILHYHWALSEF